MTDVEAAMDAPVVADNYNGLPSEVNGARNPSWVAPNEAPPSYDSIFGKIKRLSVERENDSMLLNHRWTVFHDTGNYRVRWW